MDKRAARVYVGVMQEHDIYVYGMTVLSTIHLLDGAYPAANGYREIKRTFVMPGGEGANAAVVLARFGMRPMLGGCYLGDETCRLVPECLSARGVDCSLLQRMPGFAGWRELVLCDGSTRTVFGWFISGLFGGKRLWATPNEEAIRRSRCVALDPFFEAESTKVAELCVRHGVDYVTIDCRLDNPIGGPGADLQPFTRPVNRLMMRRVHLCRIPSGNRPQSGARRNGNAMKLLPFFAPAMILKTR